MVKLECPNCAAPLKFKSQSTVFAVCPYCQATIVRHDVDLEKIGEMADLQDSMSIFQMGTTGKWDKNKFEIIGLSKIKYDEGYWNEWYLWFKNGKEAWLAEAQGELALNMPTRLPINLPPLDELAVGMDINFPQGGIFQVDDIRHIECIGSMGELPYPAMVGRKAVTVDLVNKKGEFACLDFSEEGIAAYLGTYAEFDELALKNLRQLEDW